MSWQVAGYETDAGKPFDQGSFGTIWHARRRSDGLRVALKLVLKERVADGTERIEAERRGAMLQQAFHDAHGMVPAVYDVGYDEEGNLFIAMEHVEGGALSDAIASGRIAPLLAARQAAAICAFLERAHRFSTTIEGEHYDRLVHADLKPGHVFARPDGSVIVLDFGIAKALDKSKPLTTNNWGTSAYMSPERLIDGRVDEQVDFWSLGVMLYEMLAGHRPYRALQAPAQKAQLERAIRHNTPREALPGDVPPALSAIVNKLLAYQPERRYATAAAIRADLDALFEERRPTALDEYDSVETTRVAGDATERRAPQEATEAWPAPVQAAAAAERGDVPATDRLALPPLPTPVAPAPGAEGQRQVRGVRRLWTTRRVARIALLLGVLFTAATEITAWFQAERMRSAIGAIDATSLTAARESYDRLATVGPLHLGVRWRVNGPLRTHLMGMGDRVIADFRNDQPALTVADWKQARQALQWALRIRAGDRALQSRLELCEAHILRISTRPGPSTESQAAYRRAVDRFRTAARLDRESFDPFLGLSRVAVYGLIPADVDMASNAMREAEQRGYVPGRRERALVGDGYLRRADTIRRDARTLSGDEKIHALERARDDYQGCIESFEPMVGFGNAAKNVETCKSRRAAVEAELAAARDGIDAGEALRRSVSDALGAAIGSALRSGVTGARSNAGGVQ